MFYWKINSVFLLLLALVQPGFAEVLIYPFDHEIEEKRFHSLLGELRCPKCQNQSLADSDAPISEDLRQKVYALIKEGKSDQEIRQYLIERYGEFISYRPPFRGSTLLLWAGPAVILLLALLIAVYQVRKSMQAQSRQD